MNKLYLLAAILALLISTAAQAEVNEVSSQTKAKPLAVLNSADQSVVVKTKVVETKKVQVAEKKSAYTKPKSTDDKFYVGVDGLYSHINHEHQYMPNRGNVTEGRKTQGNNVGLGLNFGYRVNADKLFVAPEIFYDYLNNSAVDFSRYTTGQSTQSRIEVQSRYGAKVNLGYNLFSDLNAFVNLGFANVRYIDRDPLSGRSSGDNKLAPIYGVGLLYDLNKSWALRASYDYQKFNARYYSFIPGSRDVVRMHVVKAGLVYSF